MGPLMLQRLPSLLPQLMQLLLPLPALLRLLLWRGCRSQWQRLCSLAAWGPTEPWTRRAAPLPLLSLRLLPLLPLPLRLLQLQHALLQL